MTSVATTTTKGNPRECSDINFDKDGVFTIYPKGDSHAKHVFCMILNGIRCMVIQRQFNGSIDFDRTWNKYKEGFGNAYTEYWLGNEYIHSLTTNGLYKLHIIIEETNGTTRYAEYSTFHVGDENTKYLLNVSNYSGNAGDCLIKAQIEGRANGMKFTTKDQDNDMWSEQNCGAILKGGWWYRECEYCLLNGENGLTSPRWRFDTTDMGKSSIMMITKI